MLQKLKWTWLGRMIFCIWGSFSLFFKKKLTFPKEKKKTKDNWRLGPICCARSIMKLNSSSFQVNRVDPNQSIVRYLTRTVSLLEDVHVSLSSLPLAVSDPSLSLSPFSGSGYILVLVAMAMAIRVSLLLLLFLSSSIASFSLYEDQVGLMDWYTHSLSQSDFNLIELSWRFCLD